MDIGTAKPIRARATARAPSHDRCRRTVGRLLVVVVPTRRARRGRRHRSVAGRDGATRRWHRPVPARHRRPTRHPAAVRIGPRRPRRGRRHRGSASPSGRARPRCGVEDGAVQPAPHRAGARGHVGQRAAVLVVRPRLGRLRRDHHPAPRRRHGSAGARSPHRSALRAADGGGVCSTRCERCSTNRRAFADRRRKRWATKS